MPATTEDPLPTLIRALRSRNAADRMKAAKDLARLGPLALEALPTLELAVQDDHPKVREAAAQATGQMGIAALPAFLDMLTHADKYVRRHGVWALGKLGPQAKPALAAICNSLKDSDPRTASGAAQAIGNMGPEGADAIAALAEAMRGTNIVLCRLAAKALSQIGTRAIATLIAHLQHADPFVRGEAALAIGWIGPPAHAAVPFLTQAVRGKKSRNLSDTPPPSASLNRAGLADSETSGDSEGTATPLGISSADSSSPEETCRVFAVQALGRMGKLAAPAIPEIRLALRTGPDPLRQAARLALRFIDPATLHVSTDTTA